MEYLVKKDGGSDGAESNPDQKLTSAAATAESLQPKGFTLETAHVSSMVMKGEKAMQSIVTCNDNIYFWHITLLMYLMLRFSVKVWFPYN
jgi:hypothetical protein